MHAVVMVSGKPEDALLAQTYSTPLLPIVDRPLIQHIVEYLVEQGFSRFDFVCDRFADQVESLLGNGCRWGSTFRFHLISGGETPYRPLRRITPFAQSANLAAPLLLVHAHCLPQINARRDADAAQEKNGLLLYQTAPSSEKDAEWTGWAWVPPFLLTTLASAANAGDMEQRLGQHENAQKQTCVQVISVQTTQGLMEAQKTVLHNEFSGLSYAGGASANGGSPASGAVPEAGSRANTGIVFGRNVTIHADARLIAPVYVGANSRIDAGAVVGPNAIIGENCLVGDDSCVRNSLVFPQTAIGNGLELDGVIADRRHLFHVRHQTSVWVPDAFLMGDMSQNPFSALVRQSGERAFALLLLFGLWPLLLIAIVMRLFDRGRGSAPLFPRREAVYLPASPDADDWWTFPVRRLCSPADEARARGGWHFLFCFLPGLLDVVAGKTRLVGVPARTPDEIGELPSDWRGLYLQSRVGLVTEALIVGANAAGHASEQNAAVQIAETVYAAHATPSGDRKLLAQYFASLLTLPTLRHDAISHKPGSGFNYQSCKDKSEYL